MAGTEDEAFSELHTGQESLASEADSQKDSGQSDPNHPNFPFPAGYTKIDFDHLNPSNFVQMAEDLMSYRQTIQEPYLKHGRKMKELEDRFDRSDERFRHLLEPRKNPLVIIRRREDNSTAPHVFFYNRPYTITRQDSVTHQTHMDIEDMGIVRRQRMIRWAQAVAWREQEFMVNMMLERARPRYAWNKGASVTRFNFDPPVEVVEPYVPDTDTVFKVQSWLDKNFVIKPVPLLLHVPRHIKERVAIQLKVPTTAVQKVIFSQPFHSSKVSFIEVAQSGRKIVKKKQARRRELHIIKGTIVSPPIISAEIENSFIPGYDLRPMRDLMKILYGPIQPHRFRYILPFGEFLDNEVVFQSQGNMLYATARSPGRIDKNPRLVEEIIEVPDGVQLSSLKFYRSMENEIVVEEDSPRPKKKKNFTNMVTGPLKNMRGPSRTTVASPSSKLQA